MPSSYSNTRIHVYISMDIYEGVHIYVKLVNSKLRKSIERENRQGEIGAAATADGLLNVRG